MTTPYRNEIDALRERKESLESELAKLRAQTTELDALRARETQLAEELAKVDGRLSDGGRKRALPLLDTIRVASPCNAEWSEMVGDERVRFCLSCEKNVYNISSMPRAEAEALLESRAGGELCVRYYQRADGTILTQDCPEGVKKKRRKKLALSIAGAGAMAAAAVSALAYSSRTCRGRATAGAVAVQGEPSMVMGDVEPSPTTPPAHEVKGDWAGPAPSTTVPPVDPNGSQVPHVGPHPVPTSTHRVTAGRMPIPRK